MSLTQNIARAKTDYNEVYEAGRKSQYDEFWDAFQKNGTLTYYYQAFAGYGWSYKNFYPKYDINMRDTAFATFQGFGNGQNGLLNMRERLEECGVKMLCPVGEQMGSTFYGASISEMPELDISKITSLNNTFGNCYYLHTVAFKLADNGNAYIQSNAFSNCTALVNLTFTSGVLRIGGLNLSAATKLSKASIISIIEHLSTTASGQGITLSKTAVDKAFATTEGGTDGSDSAEWNTLISTRTNWSISLA